jgi:hypothetical protein
MQARELTATSYVWAWQKIDDYIDLHNDEYADFLRATCGDLAAAYSVQFACDWLKDFDRVYRKFSKYPYMRYDLEKRFKWIARCTNLMVACNWFSNYEIKHLRLNTGFLHIESNDAQVVDVAKDMAQKIETQLMAELQAIRDRGNKGLYVMESAKRLARAICEGAGVELPEPKGFSVGQEKEYLAALCARLCCEKWWRRQLRVLQARKLETVARAMGMVCKRRGGYCSMVTLRRRSGQKSRNKKLLEMMQAENDAGQVYTLAQLSDLGVSNPVNRRAELMTRIRGFEEVAQEVGGWSPVFITQTCPSRYHSHNRGGGQYPNWNGSTPRDAQEYLTETWAKVRAALGRAEIPVFGFRVAEPHHDGCPHWHALFWFPADQLENALKIYEFYALEDTPPEKGRESVRFKALVDELAGGAANYIAKYISKNVDGLKADGEAWSADVVKTAVRTEAWASTWGIRQFQQIGGPSVTVYREMRRVEKDTLVSPELEAIRESADAGDWKQFTLDMGGPVLPLDERPVRAYLIKKRDDEKNLIRNKYGEFIYKIYGLMAWGCEPIKTRLFNWVISPVKKAVGVCSFEAHAPPLDLCQ